MASKSEEPLAGWLQKKGEKGIVKGFKKRWFAQRSNRLHYYKDKTQKVSMGFIDLDEVTGVQHTISSTKQVAQCGFDLITPDRTYELLTAASHERDYWVTGIKAYQRKREDQKVALIQLKRTRKTIAQLQGELRGKEEAMTELKNRNEQIAKFKQENETLSKKLKAMQARLASNESPARSPNRERSNTLPVSRLQDPEQTDPTTSSPEQGEEKTAEIINNREETEEIEPTETALPGESAEEMYKRLWQAEKKKRIKTKLTYEQLLKEERSRMSVLKNVMTRYRKDKQNRRKSACAFPTANATTPPPKSSAASLIVKKSTQQNLQPSPLDFRKELALKLNINSQPKKKAEVTSAGPKPLTHAVKDRPIMPNRKLPSRSLRTRSRTTGAAKLELSFERPTEEAADETNGKIIPTIAEKEAKIQELENKLAEEALVVQTLTEKLKIETSRVSQDQKKEMEYLERDLSDKDSQISVLEIEKNTLQMLVAERDSRITALESEKQVLEGNLLGSEKQDNRIRDLEADLSVRDSHVSELESEKNALQLLLSEKDAQIAALESAKKLLDTDLAEKDSQISSLASNNEMLQSNISDSEKHEQQQSAKDDQIASLQSNLTEKDSRITSLEMDKKKLEADLTEKNSRIQQQETTLLESEKRQTAKDDQITSLQTDLSEKESRISASESKITDLLKQIDMKDSQVASLDAEKKANEADLSEKDTRIISLEGEANVLKTELSQKESQIMSLEAAKKEVEANLSESEKTKLQQQTARENKISEYESQIASLQAEISQKDSAISTLAIEKGALQMVITEKEARISALTTEKGALQMAITEKDSQIAHLDATTKSLQHDTTETQSQLDEDVTKLKILLSDKDSQNAVLQKQIHKITEKSKAELAARQEEFKMVQNKLVTEIARSDDQEKKLAKLHGENDALKSLIQEANTGKNSLRESMQKQLDDLSSALGANESKWVAKLESLQEIITSQQTKIAELESQQEILQEAAPTADEKKDIARLKEELKLSQQAHESAAEKVARKKEKIKSLHSEVDQYKQKFLESITNNQDKDIELSKLTETQSQVQQDTVRRIHFYDLVLATKLHLSEQGKLLCQLKNWELYELCESKGVETAQWSSWLSEHLQRS